MRMPNHRQQGLLAFLSWLAAALFMKNAPIDVQPLDIQCSIRCTSSEHMNINLGAPYEAKLRKIIEKGYAGNQTEAIRQAINELDRKIDEEEAYFVHKGVERIMQKIDSGEMKTYTHEQVKRKLRL